MKHPAFRNLLFLLLALAGLQSCTEIFSADISEEVMVVNGPSDSLFTDDGSVQFWWDENEKVEQYQLQIVTPDFSTPTLVFDSLMVVNTLDIQFEEEGIYAWRLRGVNEGSETEWVERMLVFDETAPYLPTSPNHHLDTLASTAVDSLTWSSADAPISGVTFPVADSIYISRANDSTAYQIVGFLDEDERSVYYLDVLNDLEGAGTYFWRVISKDKAGNRRAGNWFKFVVQ